ncbi:hypothetical protein Nos7524_4476 [Nostoc sp. PCC 7524]|uniref:hypothetical protein n=1 Tax=Nostoc sp. (strain ATCC 29411 / PCC 7524) TaxID=28072 RepID=UPI00029F41ED|nr:hypothetical protein [Nostoc sp. PCC 7524]AFY50231.1 hypothetical protein Nos7524_4476 [Nostoc sp. PCC 7524]
MQLMAVVFFFLHTINSIKLGDHRSHSVDITICQLKWISQIGYDKFSRPKSFAMPAAGVAIAKK